MRDPCRSRVLESALALALMRQCGSGHRDERDRLVRYLERHRGGEGLMDTAVAAVALGRNTGRPSSRQALEDVVSRVPDFTGGRKRALVHAVFAMLGAAVAQDDVDPHTFDAGTLHPWAGVQSVAVKAILGRVAGGAPADRDDVTLLASTQRPGTVWEGNLFIHLSVLHALLDVPGMEGAVDAGLRTALMHQREDGGLPFVTDTDTWCTVTAGLALSSAGAPREVLHRIARHLVHVQRANGGWSYTDRAQLSDTDCTTVAIEFLHHLDADAYRAPIRHALEALVAVRGTDGGFPTYGSGTPSEACMTAAAINALSTEGHHRHHHLIQAALRFLADRQNPDGSFPPGWSSSRLHTVFRAYLAARHHRQSAPAVRDMSGRIADLVRNAQNADGGFGQHNGAPSDAISTAYALIVLAGQLDAAPASRATGYLLGQQRPDGSIVSVPDMLGPRPFPYHVPLLTDAFALLALGHLTPRLRPSRVVMPGRRHSSARSAQRTAP
ncbi:prenyltransferase/squalene oxidase repeat-containing protein [Streptomyces lancefieldiae]|uniref:Prenyltransferase/squalene oxidase repeat-containing protein n=1 Tax=Streptomyces lancefieldiae TaxID=3075520 RepID=A0ABU3AM93_9ACTN|nr:prenyltransferase/squalene oxidase repeat-containing protein [Streptomyces sp. DSM 40712]MDT0611073.1 prenyltransferase/squalene oxidase repeat-containing protein [Streptomyces sp. DSM 40712]